MTQASLHQIYEQLAWINKELSIFLSQFLWVSPESIPTDFIQKFEWIRKGVLAKIPHQTARYEQEKSLYIARVQQKQVSKKWNKHTKSPPYSDPRIQNIKPEERRHLLYFQADLEIPANIPSDVALRALNTIRNIARTVLDWKDPAFIAWISSDQLNAEAGRRQVVRLHNFLHWR